jgi:hypothetical protein
MANAPLKGRDSGDIEVILVSVKQKYFCKQDWTGQISLIQLKKFAVTCKPAGWVEPFATSYALDRKFSGQPVGKISRRAGGLRFR